MPDVYEPNPKHKHPWQPGAKGTLCPRDVDGVALFRTSVTDPSRPGKRYNTDGRQAYCAHPNTKRPSPDSLVVWHGYPVEWREVPVPVQRHWVAEGLIRRLRLRG